MSGDPGQSTKLDRDGDAIAVEGLFCWASLDRHQRLPTPD